jgi:ATP-dependent Lon protease
MTEKNKNYIKLPLLPLRDPELVVFPDLLCEIDVGRPFSVKSINKAKSDGTKLIIAMQNDSTIDHPAAENFYSYCTEVEIKSLLSLDKENTKLRIIVVGMRRGILKIVGEEDGRYWGEMDPIIEPQGLIDDEIIDLIKQTQEMIKDRVQFIVVENGLMPTNYTDLSRFVDGIAGQLPISGVKRVTILGTVNPKDRLKLVVNELAVVANNVEVEVGSSEHTNDEQGSESTHGFSNEVKELNQRIEKAGIPTDVMKTIKADIRRLSMMSPNNSEFQITYNYLDTLASLPWNKTTEDKLDIVDAEKVLNEDHYGLEKVKERILEFLAVRKLKPERKGSILCFFGSPGVGKTSLGKSIARAMGREFIRISLGGTNDEAEIRGHRRTYVGALPGSIIENIRRVKSKNPVFMLDEVDKLCANFRGDPSSALLEVLDPEQNHAFTDHYLNVPFDLSQVFFIGTVNEISPIAPALRDRLEIIEIPGYSPSDKIKIANGHLIPKQKEANGMADKDISLSTQAITKIIEEYTSEAGVRSLERECGTIMRKMAVLVASEKEPPKIIDADMIPKYLGPPKSFTEKAAEKPEIGLSTGLAWSRHGGSLLFIETLLTPGKGKVKLTGNLGKVIQESADAAHTWICASANKLGIPAKMLKQYDVHIHFPSGSVPKEGPSAGVAIAASMLSAFTNRPVRNDIAMTGEITLRGRVLPIGGLKEKILAAHRAGIKQVIFPEKNKHDIEEIPADVAKEMIFTTVSNLEEALDILLLDKTTPVESGDISPGSGEELMNKEVSGTK